MGGQTSNKVWIAIIVGVIGWYSRQHGVDFGLDETTVDFLFTTMIVPAFVWATSNRTRIHNGIANEPAPTRWGRFKQWAKRHSPFHRDIA